MSGFVSRPRTLIAFHTHAHALFLYWLVCPRVLFCPLIVVVRVKRTSIRSIEPSPPSCSLCPGVVCCPSVCTYSSIVCELMLTSEPFPFEDHETSVVESNHVCAITFGGIRTWARSKDTSDLCQVA